VEDVSGGSKLGEGVPGRTVSCAVGERCIMGWMKCRGNVFSWWSSGVGGWTRVIKCRALCRGLLTSLYSLERGRE
jgi:hypothetical protein